MSSLVSIIIPTFNRAHLIGETLDSVRAQSYTNWECIVVDDGSTDETELVLQKYQQQDARFIYVKRPENRRKGGNAARNYGFEICSGEFVQWFDSDDIMSPEKLLTQLTVLEDNENHQFSICRSLIFKDTTENISRFRSKIFTSTKIQNNFINLSLILLTPSTLWRKSFLNDLKYLFDEELLAAQEWEFYARNLKNDDNYIFLSAPLNFIREHSESITYQKNRKKKVWHYFLARYKIYFNKDLTLDDEIRNYLKQYMIKSYKKMLRNKLYCNALNTYKLLFLSKEFAWSQKKYAIFALMTFFIFGKGERFLNKIR